ncbi:MAG: 50S ribosomal protein L25 [bacterium]|nr:50S ribosomal protein L25 [bacterium]
MTQKFLLEAQPRTLLGRRAKQVRIDDMIPAVVYGHGITAQSIQVGKVAFEKLYREAGESSLVDLTINGNDTVKVLIQDIQVDPLRGDVIHADFNQVRMDEMLETEITIRFVDEAPAVKELGGTLVRSVDHFSVRCLPTALVHEIDVSTASLKTFEDKIHVRDIALPEGIEIINSADDVVAFVEEPRSEEEMAALESAPELKVEEVKVATEEKKAEREKEKEAEAAQ